MLLPCGVSDMHEQRTMPRRAPRPAELPSQADLILQAKRLTVVHAVDDGPDLFAAFARMPAARSSADRIWSILRQRTR